MGNNQWRIVNITSLDEVKNRESLTMDDLSVQFRTGWHTSTGRGFDRVVTNHAGMATDIGNIEISVWTVLAKEAIAREKGEDFLQIMKDFYELHGTPADKIDLETTALESCVDKLYERKEWVLQDEFNAFLAARSKPAGD